MSNSNPCREARQNPPPGFTRGQPFILLALVAVLGLTSCAPKSPTATHQPASSPASTQTSKTPEQSGAPKTQATTSGTMPGQVWQEKLKQAAAKPSAPFEGTGWEAMFDGAFDGWAETSFAGHGEVQCESGLLILNMGDPFTGVNYTNGFPKMGYEIALDAMRLMGSDFFCGLTVPYGDSHCTLIVGGWGGGLVGISSLDGMDASENETTKYMNFEQGRWYRIRLRITEGRLEGWIDNEKLINVLTKDRKISLRPGDIEMSKPLGVACWQTSAALREIKYRRIDQPDGPPRKY
jgi:hypothetical protein